MTRNFNILIFVSIVCSMAMSCNKTTTVIEQRKADFNSEQKNVAEKPVLASFNSSFIADDYPASLRNIDKKLVEIASEYVAAKSKTEKDEAVEKARKLFINSIYENIFPFWYGTEWDFYGTTETPKSGKIACGYFVSTVLRDAGLKVERARMAQQASENIVLSLTTNKFVKRFHNIKITDFVKTTREMGAGVYVVGLDVHVGFIVNTGEDVFFIHSSYGDAMSVIKENALNSEILASSKYRVLGKISDDDALIIKWLMQTKIPTKKS